MSDAGGAGGAGERSGEAPRWDALPWEGVRVRALRGHLGETQAAFADRLGTNQQTVSGWERGARRPRRMARRLLHLVAEQAAFYSADAPATPPADAPPETDPPADGGDGAR